MTKLVNSSEFVIFVSGMKRPLRTRYNPLKSLQWKIRRKWKKLVKKKSWDTWTRIDLESPVDRIEDVTEICVAECDRGLELARKM